MLEKISYGHSLVRLLQFRCLIVILFTVSTTSFAQNKLLPAGFPADCPMAQPLLKKAVNNSPARIYSDSLAKKAKDLLSQLNKENVLGAIAILEKADEIDSMNAAVFYQLSSAYGSAPRYAGMLKKTGDEKSLSYFLTAFS